MISPLERGIAFSGFLGAELKGAIASRNMTVAEVARELGKDRKNMSQWLNGQRVIAADFLSNVCEVIGIEPSIVVSRASERLYEELGAPTQHTNADIVLLPHTQAKQTAKTDLFTVPLHEERAAADTRNRESSPDDHQA